MMEWNQTWAGPRALAPPNNFEVEAPGALRNLVAANDNGPGSRKTALNFQTMPILLDEVVVITQAGVALGRQRQLTGIVTCAFAESAHVC